MPRTGATRSKPHRLHQRQSKRQERRKRGAHIDPHGFDAGKLIKGKKRHILVDTLGLLLHAIVHSAGIQDRDGGILLLARYSVSFRSSRRCLPTAPIRDRFLRMRSSKSYPISKLKLSDDLTTPKDSCGYPSVGSSNAPSHGSTVVAVSPRIGKISTATPSRPCNFPPS